MAPAAVVTHAIPTPIDPIAAIYRAHSTMLVAYLVTFTRDRALAEDLAQEAFARLIVQARGPTSLPLDPAAWLVRWVETSRSRMPGTGAWASGSPHASRRPGPHAPPRTLPSRSWPAGAPIAALDALDDDARTAVAMSAAGYSGVEASARLGRTPLATRALTCRARRRLREATVLAE